MFFFALRRVLFFWGLVVEKQLMCKVIWSGDMSNDPWNLNFGNELKYLVGLIVLITATGLLGE